MKILHLVDHWGPKGGIETYTRSLIPRLRERGHESVVMALGAGREETGQESPDKNDVHAAVAEHAPDVILAHDVYKPKLLAAAAAQTPTVCYVHIFYPVCPGLGKLFRRDDRICERPFGVGCLPNVYLRKCATARHPLSVARIMRQTAGHLRVLKSLPAVLVASRYMKSLLIQNGVSPDRVERIPYLTHPPEADQNDRPKTETAEILFAGRIEYEKGLPYLLEASTKIEVPHRLVVAGTGSEEAACRELAARLGVESHVQFLGWRTQAQLAEAYRRATVVAMPSLMPEPYGLVGIEGHSHGTPVVAFDVGGIPDWLIHAENGYLVAPRDVEGLASYLNELLRDQGTARRFGRNGYQRVLEKNDPSVHVERLLRVLGMLIEPGVAS